MITVYVLVSFYDENGIHKAGTFTEVKEENFDPKYMQKVEGGSGDAYTKAETDALLDAKQDDLTAGTNIQISDQDVISATDTGDTVSYTATQSATNGAECGKLTINGTDKKIYSPKVQVTQVQSTGTKIATVKVGGTSTDLYAPNAGGGGGVSSDVIADEFDTEQHVIQTIYNQYDFVKYQGYQYYWSPTDNNTTEPGSGAWLNAGTNIVTLDSWGSNVNPNQIFTYNNVYYVNKSSSQQFIRPDDLPGNYSVATDKGDWSGGSTDYVHYDVGDYCIYEDELYVCTGSTTGESWDSTKWNQITVMSQISGGSGGSTITTFDMYYADEQMSFSDLALDAANTVELHNNSVIAVWSNIYSAFTQGTVYIKDSNDVLAQLTFCDPTNDVALFNIYRNNQFYVFMLQHSSGADWECDCLNYNN